MKRVLIGFGVSLVNVVVDLSGAATFAQQVQRVPFEALSYCGQLDLLQELGSQLVNT